ncbi:MAG: hypothetical protein CM1200mP3_04550 [Chloroflexota bacterium]|nr:MAG: hypothetical protein CM1200mP3_04550 [Chloroflexota bacterium]
MSIPDEVSDRAAAMCEPCAKAVMLLGIQGCR